MLRNFLRIFVILIIAGALAGGVYVFSNIVLTQSTGTLSFESQLEQAVGVSTASLNTDGAQAVASARDFDHRPPENLPIWIRFSGILGHMVVIAGITVAVTYIQKLIKRLSVKPKALMNHQKMQKQSQPNNLPA